MNKTNKTNKTKSVKRNTGRRSMKGKWGKVGAPPKPTSWPKGAFTYETLFNRNKKQCELSLRTKVDVGVADGSIVELKSKKQAGGAVGRPKAVFVLKENFDSKKHEVAPPKKAKAPTAVQPAIEVVETVAPATPPVVDVIVPALETVVEVVTVSAVPTVAIDVQPDFIPAPVVETVEPAGAAALVGTGPVSPIFG